MRFMETVRKKGATGIWIFAGVMLVSILGGLGVGAYYSPIMQGDRNEQMGMGASDIPVVSRDGRYDGVAMYVNDRPVSLDEFAANYEFMTRNYLQDRTDYEMMLMIYGETARKLVRDEVLLGRGEEHGVTVTDAEIEEQRNDIIDQFMAAQEDTTGNIVGDLAMNLSKNKARREAFRTYLQRSGMDNATWERNVRRSLQVTNAQEKLIELANAEKEQQMNETRLLIDDRLEDGELFSELAREFSDDSNAENGGDLNTWVFPGLLQNEEHDAALFSTPVGETTEWFEIPAGLQRFQVYEKREAEGPEFEEKKPELIQDIKDEKGEDYEPTDEEVADLYRAVKARQIQLNNSDPTSAYEEISEMVATAKVEINLPYVLAYQALMDDRLYTAEDVSFEDLKAIASNAHVGENYDFDIIRPKWDNRLPEAREEAEEETAAEDEADAPAEAPAEAGADVTEDMAQDVAGDETAAADSETAAGEEAAAGAGTEGEEAGTDTEPVASVEDALVVPDESVNEADERTPLYALAIGYLKMGQAAEGDNPSMFSYWLVADTYMDWLDNEDGIIGQQVDRPAARQEVEENLAQVVESDNYNAAAHAARGTNLAWLDRQDEARSALESAMKYVANADTPTLDMIQAGYEQLDDEDGLAAVEEKRAAARQEQMQQAIQEAQTNPGNSIPFSDGEIQLPDIEDLENMDLGNAAADTDEAGGDAASDAEGEGSEGDAGAEGTEDGGQSAGGDTADDGGQGAGDDTPAEDPVEEPAGE